jgi:16S rRNA (uracil1498-N3)-methyltransferase
MTRRRFYAPPSAFSLNDKTVMLSAEETRHARNVLRLEPGDDVYVFDGEGREYRCELTAFDRDSTKLWLIEPVEPARPESPLDLTLAVALLKGEKFDLVVQKATELGVFQIVPVITTRADVRLRDANDVNRKLERWRRIALESTKQCGRARIMEIATPINFGSLIDDRKRETELRIMFAERGGTSLKELVTGNTSPPKRLVALVGSEGGWSDEEISQARAQSWRVVTLGGRTLRAETAAIVVAGLLQHAFGDLV